MYSINNLGTEVLLALTNFKVQVLFREVKTYIVIKMGKIFSTLIFTLFLSATSHAENIKNLSIEGISIGEDLAKYFSIQDIEKNIFQNKSSTSYDHLKYPRKFLHVEFTKIFGEFESQIQTYDSIQVLVKKISNKYEIYGIIGKIFYTDNIRDCVPKRDEIASEFKRSLKNYQLEGPSINKHESDRSGESKVNQIAFWFSNDDIILVECYDWSPKMKYYDNLKVNILSDEVNRWLSGR